MNSLKSLIEKLHFLLLSEKAKKRIERVTLILSIASFIIHLACIYLTNVLPFLNPNNPLLGSPIAAVYTPFSFILIYEVYLLVFYLPRSITTYISKQYEIISLIIIRRLFKDLGNLKLTTDWFSIKGDLQFTYDIIASVILFYLLYWFYRLNSHHKKTIKKPSDVSEGLDRFVRLKKGIAIVLVPLLLALALYTFGNWGFIALSGTEMIKEPLKNVNNIFFDEFFTVLIIVDVLLLLVSFFYTDKYFKVIRNSGFVISTILIRISFSVEGLVNTVLIVFAVVFGLTILAIHNQFEKKIQES